jgi:membrane-bound lytic murein transglycosylase D
MPLRSGLATLLILASCVPAARAPAPAPAPASRPEPEVRTPPPAVPDAPARAAAVEATRDTARRSLPVSLSDSLVLARMARDSALDASVLEALAQASPPDSLAGDDAEAAAWRAMFDIDVANWMDHHRVKYYLDLFQGPVRERMAIWLERMPRYEPIIRAKLIARGLPGDLAYLPLIESGYSSTAVSRSRAVGMWQFMRGTARLYGLTVDSWVDERRDVPRATDAAIRFLADLTAKFGSPYLAAAAYNGGPGRIERGLARIEGYETAAADDLDGEAAGPHPGDAAFFQLADTRHIMRETKDYVPKLIAAAMIAKQPERYGFPPIPKVRAEEPDSVVVSDATGLDVIAKAAGMTMAELWAANPMYLRGVTPPRHRAVVRVPAGRGAEVQARLDALPAAARLSPIVHHVKRGETSATIARRYGLTVAELRAANPALKARAPRGGEALEIPGRARLAGWVAENRRVIPAAEGPSGGPTHRVARGETLSHLSRWYGVSVAKLRAWNRLGPNTPIRVGQILRVRPPAARAPAGRTTSRRSS